MEIAFFCLMVPASVGAGSFMTVIGKVRGWNTKRTFWLSSLGYLSIMIGLFLILWYANDILHVIYAYEIFNVLAVILILFGVVFSPVIVLMARMNKFGIFGKSIPASVASSLNPQGEDEKDDLPHQQDTDIAVKASIKADDTVSFGNIFISYRRVDSADITGRIYDRLIGKFGRGPVFKDVDSIPLGIDFKEYLDMKVGECSVLLAVIGDRWLEAGDSSGKRRLDDPADFVRIELESALERNIPVIPLLVRGAQMPSEGNLPPSLRKLAYRNGIPIRSDPDFHRDMDRLIKALEGYVG
jgi:hypothetical protein